MDQAELLQLGAMGIILLFTIKELFSYLKSRNDSPTKPESQPFTEAIFKELQTMNNNHLQTLQETIEQDNARLVDSMHNDNTKIIELLGEIKGHLQSRR